MTSKNVTASGNTFRDHTTIGADVIVVDRGPNREDARTAQDNARRVRVLFLAANPAETSPLDLNSEMAAVQEQLRRGQYGKEFELRSHWALQSIELDKPLRDFQPDVVHFSGHGKVGGGGIVLEDAKGKPRLVEGGTLGRIFSLLDKQVRCVVLNSCYSEEQAQAIASHVGAVVGMAETISNEAALAFSTRFYRGLASGEDLWNAFEGGRLAVECTTPDQRLVPRLLGNGGPVLPPAIQD